MTGLMQVLGDCHLASGEINEMALGIVSEIQNRDRQSVGSYLLPKKGSFVKHKLQHLTMSVSSTYSMTKQNQKKTIQILSKKTYFSEMEVGKLLDCHFQIMVG